MRQQQDPDDVLFRDEVHEDAQGHLCETRRLRLAPLASWVVLVTSHDWTRCDVRQLCLCCTARTLCSKANLPQMEVLHRVRQVHYDKSHTVPVDATRECESLFDARHHGRSRLICLLDVSATMLGSSAMVDRLCNVVAAESFRQAEIHQSQQEDPRNY